MSLDGSAHKMCMERPFLCYCKIRVESLRQCPSHQNYAYQTRKANNKKTMAQISISTRKQQIFKGRIVPNREYLPTKQNFSRTLTFCRLLHMPEYSSLLGSFLSIRGIADSIVSSEPFHIDINDREPFIPTTASGF